MSGARFQKGEQAADRLADASGRLRQQAAGAVAGLVHGFGQFALTGPKIGMRELHAQQHTIAPATVRHFLFGPLDKATAQQVKEVLEFNGGKYIDKDRFFLAGDIKIDQCQFDMGAIKFLALQMTVYFGLRPVQCAVIVGHRAKIAAKSFDLLQPVQLWIITIGAAAHMQRPETAFQAEFPLVAD